jgi:predicted RNA-binding protein associated with RNAse of E/G family
MPKVKLRFIRPPEREDTYVHGLVEDLGDTIVSDFTYTLPHPFRVEGRVAIRNGDRGLLFECSEGYEIIPVERKGKIVGHYLNINLPFEREPGGYSVKDLFLDIWVWEDGCYSILDEDEFAEACQKNWITTKEREFALNIKDVLVSMLEKGDLPSEPMKIMTSKWLVSLKDSQTSEG